jgi:recombination protein RecT
MNALVNFRDQAAALIDDIKPDLVGLLKEVGVPFERFKATFTSAVVGNPDILRCDRTSIVQAIVKCATDGLMPDNREAAMVPFRTKVKDPSTGKDLYLDLIQYLPMIAGVRKRARELGGVIIDAEDVCEKDIFDHQGGDEPFIHHKRAPLGTKRGNIIGAYAIFRKEDGTILHREVMDAEQIEAARAVSRAKNSPAWANFYGEMARKTVARRGSKSVPNLNDKLRTIIEREDEYANFDQVAIERAEKNIDHNPLLDQPRQRTISSNSQAPMDIVKDRAPSSAEQEQRNSTSQVAGSNPAAPSSSSSATISPSRADDDRRGDETQAQQPTRLPAELMKKYASGLARMNTTASVEKAHAMFWGDHEKPAAGTPDFELAARILNANDKRTRGEIEATGFADEIEAMIDESYGAAA